jgi:hypothetical protein
MTAVDTIPATSEAPVPGSPTQASKTLRHLVS